MKAIAAAPPRLSKQRICQAMGEPRHRCYPDRRQRVRPKVETVTAAEPRRLTAEQGQAILDTLHSERFVDASPRQVYAQLLSEGTVLASIATFYRRLRALEESVPRRAQRPPQRHVAPQLSASAVHQVWPGTSPSCPPIAVACI